MPEAIKSIRLDELRALLYQEDSVIAAEDVPLLMRVIIDRVTSGQLVSMRQSSWEHFQEIVHEEYDAVVEENDDGWGT